MGSCRPSIILSAVPDALRERLAPRGVAQMYVRRCELSVPTSGTRDRRLRGYLVSFARCLRVETDLAAAVLHLI